MRLLLADDAALTNSLDIKGASGIMPCHCCVNVMRRGYAAHAIDDAREIPLLDIGSLETDRFEPQTNQGSRKENSTDTKTARENASMRLGSLPPESSANT